MIRMTRLRDAARQVKLRMAAHALILLYHRVDELVSDPFLLGVTPQHFAEHLEAVCRLVRPMGLHELVRGLQEGHAPGRAVVITFDDGYVDNLEKAKPLLEKYGVPATVFVTVGGMERKRAFWWDELASLLLQPSLLPETLRMTVDGHLYQWELGTAAQYREHDYWRDRDWHVERAEEPGLRQHLFRCLYELLYDLPEREQWKSLDELQAQTTVLSNGHSMPRSLSREELLRLAHGGLVDIGAHTLTHPALGKLSASAQRDEIQQSKQYLEEILGNQVRAFAYPHGSFTPETIEMVRDAGFSCAGSSEPDAVWPHADRYRLPRLAVRDWDGEAFARWLSGWFGS